MVLCGLFLDKKTFCLGLKGLVPAKFSNVCKVSLLTERKRMMIVCSIQNVSQTIGANKIFSNITTEIKQGDRIGLIGRNGEGKTTLLDLIARKTVPSSGVITWKKSLQVDLLEQVPNIDAGKNVEAILYEVFASIEELKINMSQLEQKMSTESNSDRLTRIIERYGLLQEKFQQVGSYEIDSHIKRIMRWLYIEQFAIK